MEAMQRLNQVGADLHTASMLTELNSNILRQQLDYYRALFQDDDFPVNIKTGCRRNFEDFAQRIGSIRDSLQMEQARIATMMLILEDGKNMVRPVYGS
jgi:hypothetical protein